MTWVLLVSMTVVQFGQWHRLGDKLPKATGGPVVIHTPAR